MLESRDMKLVDDTIKDITDLKIQGATNVAIAVLNTIETLLTQIPDISKESLKEIGHRLATARPTEPLAQNAIWYIFSGTTNDIIQKIQEYQKYITDAKLSIPNHGSDLILNGGTYLTICHSATVVDVFQKAHASGKTFRIFVAETRPLFQGRITATELINAGILDVTMVIDDVAIGLLETNNEHIDAVFMGADLLSEQGFANKVGSLAVAAAANRQNIPVYTVSTLLKYERRPFHSSMIEMRNSHEIWETAPTSLKFYAPAFDFVPYFPNVKIICEAGIIFSKDIKSSLENIFPFVTNNTNTA